MSWPRASLFVALLAISTPWASADTITVNTTTDDFSKNDLCSLREAVEYFNRGRPSDGFQGCKSESEDSSAKITLPGDEASYVISSARGAIKVYTGLSINGAGRKDTRLADEQDQEPTITTIEVEGEHRAFIINLDPEFLPPRCARATTKSCAPTLPGSTAFYLDPDSDTSDPDVPGTESDYLTTARQPVIKGTLPGITANPVPNRTYVIRLYDKPRSGDPVLVGTRKVEFSDEDMGWEIQVNRDLEDGVHHLSYTLEVINTADGKTITAESKPGPTLKFAVHAAPIRQVVSFTNLIIKGGCEESPTACATPFGVETINDSDPSLPESGYDEYLLSFVNRAPVSTANNGGIIFNNEMVTLAGVTLQGGHAGKGGALYNAPEAVAQIKESDFQMNSAAHGAAIFSESNSLSINQSLFTENQVSDATGAVVEVADATIVSGVAGTEVANSTFSANAGRALSLRSNMSVNASTIVLNGNGGIDFNNQDVAVYNSILVDNAGKDCEQKPSSSDKFTHNLVRTGSGASCPETGNQPLSDSVQLLADTVACDSELGILCPLDDRGGATRVHMPRLLPGYASIADSPIINKASPDIGRSTVGACPSNDQRGNSRTVLACDIGAVELQTVPSGDLVRSGGATPYNRTYIQSLKDELADEELVPARKCAELSGISHPATPPFPAYPPDSLADPTKVVPNTYRPDIPGCPWLEVSPTRGVVTFESDNDFDGDGAADSDTDKDGDIDGDDEVRQGAFYSYTADSNYHGFDRFTVRVVTTVSNLNALQADRSRQISAQVIVEPAGKLKSSSVGGAFDAWGVLVLTLSGLGWRMRKKA